MQPHSQPARFAKSEWLLFLAVALVPLLFAVSGRSLWIDEAWTAYFARLPSLNEWWTQLVAERETNLQMPVYTLWIWACEKIFGSEEFTLRFLNFFWFLPALAVAARAFRGRTLAVMALLVAALSPFAWYYLNEARSYVMQLSAALVAYAAVVRLGEPGGVDSAAERRWVWVFAIGMIGLCASSLLAMFLGLIPLGLLVVSSSWARMWQLLRLHLLVWIGLALVLTAVAGFYLWTLGLGARATGIAGTDWRNPLLAAYELGGFAGLGPSRSAIRESGASALKPFLPGLMLYGVAAALMVAGAMTEWRQHGGRRLLIAGLVVVVPVAVLLLASHLMHFRILGRHFAALFPVAWLVYAAGLAWWWRRGLVGRLIAVAFLAFSLASALSLRFAKRHLKDDYRAVAAVARAELARGGVAWWSGDKKAADYYSVPLTPETSTGPAAWWVANPDAAGLAQLPRPKLVICGRPDVYDAGGSLAAWLRAEGYLIQMRRVGFVVWVAP